MTGPSSESLRDRIHAAETPALLMLVAHVTDDPTVLRPEWRPNPDLLPAGTLDPEVAAQVREYCLARLDPFLEAASDWPLRPSREVLEAIGAWSLGSAAADIPDLLDAAFVAEHDDRRAPGWHRKDLAGDRSIRVAIIGAGFSGLLAGLRMKQAGVEFTIFEKNHEVGGTWCENTYPDCRTDVHSHIYSFSFFPYEWPSYFSRQQVILDYLRTFAEANDLLPHIRFGTEVADASWDELENKWVLRTVDRDVESTENFDVLVSAVGQLNRPYIPSIDGLDTFAGPAFHSAQWDHSVDFTGRRVAVIGTGASALQFTPALADVAEQITVFQRSAPWLHPTPELRQDIGADERWLFRCLPLYRSYYRFSIFLPRVIGHLTAATVDPDYPPTERAVSAANERLRTLLYGYLTAQIGDRTDLTESVVPDYPPGAKRIVRDDGTWLRTLKRENVRLVSNRITRVDETGVWTDSGEHVPADVILFGTGFQASDFLAPMSIRGVGGKDLRDMWGIDACAYMGITMPDFPNLFCLYGPNTNLVLHGNLVFFIECQVNYLTTAVRLLLETSSAAMVLRPEIYKEYQDEIVEASALRVWGWSKTHSWYKNAGGRSTIMWPLTAQRYLEDTSIARAEHYEFL